MADTGILGGARRTKTRPRGFAAWNPHAETLDLIGHVQRVLAEYEAHLPLTVRQIFYRLVGAHAYEKTEQAYDRLGEHINRARRARMIPMASIRDDGSARITPSHWSSPEAFLETVRASAAAFRLDRTAGQKTRLAVVCEAAGMGPQLGRVADPYGVTVFPSGGFDSTTVRYELAQWVAEHEQPTEFLHIGDHDPSGAHLFLAFAEDVEAFAESMGTEVSFTRLAVTPDQIAAMGLPTAPPKVTDKRAFAGQTCQVEAIPPDVLSEVLDEALRSRIDQRALDRVLASEKRARKALLARL